MGAQPQIDEMEFHPDSDGIDPVGLVGLSEYGPLSNADIQELITLAESRNSGARPIAYQTVGKFDLELCRKLAQVGMGLDATASVIGVPIEVVCNNLEAIYGESWEVFSGTCRNQFIASVQLLMASMVKTGRQPLLLIKMMDVLGLGAPARVELTGKGGGPIQAQTVTVNMTPDELSKRRQELMKVVDRPARFAGTGVLSPTLELTEENHEGAGSAPVV